MELGFEAGERFIIAPRGFNLKGVKGKIGYVGMRHADTEWISSGMNEYCLSVEGNALVASKYAPEGDSPYNYLNLDAINAAWSMVNEFDIPRGTLYWRWLDPAPQMAGYSIVADPKIADYYFRTYKT